MWFAEYLLCQNVITKEQLVEALIRFVSNRTPVGQLAIKNHYLTKGEVAEILKIQALEPRPFGEIAIEKGLLTLGQVHQLIGQQRCEEPGWQKELVAMKSLSESQLKDHLKKWYWSHGDVDAVQHGP